MDLTPGKQRLLFVVIAGALVALGAFLIAGRRSDGTPAASASSSAPTVSASAAQSGVPPSTVPAATPVATAGGAEIYQWLPFTAADLAAAAQATVSFAADYATWSYTESAAAYGAKLSGLVTADEETTLEDDYDTSGVAGPRTADKQVSTGSGTIDSIYSFGSDPTSITFVVTISQQVTSTQPTKSLTGQYSVTVDMSGSTWQVYDIELSTLGNE